MIINVIRHFSRWFNR